jgi:hypothetical protein
LQIDAAGGAADHVALFSPGRGAEKVFSNIPSPAVSTAHIQNPTGLWTLPEISMEQPTRAARLGRHGL